MYQEGDSIRFDSCFAWGELQFVLLDSAHRSSNALKIEWRATVEDDRIV